MERWKDGFVYLAGEYPIARFRMFIYVFIDLRITGRLRRDGLVAHKDVRPSIYDLKFQAHLWPPILKTKIASSQVGKR